MKYSELRGKDLEELIEYVINIDLVYRSTLHIDEANSFGVEIEYERALRKLVEIYMRKYFPGWQSKSDDSLIIGGELTTPIIGDNIRYWEELKKVCVFLRKLHVVTWDNAAGHIHTGAQILGEDVSAWRTFVKTYAIYEDILFRFLYGSSKEEEKKY